MQYYEDFVDLLKQNGKTISNLPLMGKNQDGEDVILSFHKTADGKYFKTETIQNNNWIKISIYWEDGTYEEMYDK